MQKALQEKFHSIPNALFEFYKILKVHLGNLDELALNICPTLLGKNG